MVLQIHTFTTALCHSSSRCSNRCKYWVILIFPNTFPELSSDWSDHCMWLLSSSRSPVSSCHTCACTALENWESEWDTSIFSYQGWKFLTLPFMCGGRRCSNTTHLLVFLSKFTIVIQLVLRLINVWLLGTLKICNMFKQSLNLLCFLNLFVTHTFISASL